MRHQSSIGWSWLREAWRAKIWWTEVWPSKRSPRDMVSTLPLQPRNGTLVQACCRSTCLYIPSMPYRHVDPYSFRLGWKRLLYIAWLFVAEQCEWSLNYGAWGVWASWHNLTHEHAAILNTLRHEEHWQVGQSSLKRTFGEIAALFKQVTQPLGLSRPVSSSAPGGHWTFTTWASIQKKFCHVHDLMLEAASQQWYTWLGTSNF